jgi:CspA family cold shock protein
MTSTVKWWDERKGYGFIINPDRSGNDFFVHHSNILGKNGRRSLKDGQRVEFETEENEKGTRATGVVPL